MKITDDRKQDGFLLSEKFEKEGFIFDAVLWMDHKTTPKLVFGVQHLTRSLLSACEKFLELALQHNSYCFTREHVEFVSCDSHPVIQLLSTKMSTEGIGTIALQGTVFKDILIPDAFIYKL